MKWRIRPLLVSYPLCDYLAYTKLTFSQPEVLQFEPDLTLQWWEYRC